MTHRDIGPVDVAFKIHPVAFTPTALFIGRGRALHVVITVLVGLWGW